MEEFECKGKSHSICFSSSQPIVLHGIIVYGCLEGSAIYQVKVEIKEQNSVSQSGCEFAKRKKTQRYIVDTTTFDRFDAKLKHMETSVKGKDSENSREEYDNKQQLQTSQSRDSHVTHMVIATERTIHTCDLMLAKTVEIWPGKLYSCSLQMDGPPTKLGFHGKSEVSTEGVTFKFHNREESCSSVEKGQIPGILFTLPTSKQ